MSSYLGIHLFSRIFNFSFHIEIEITMQLGPHTPSGHFLSLLYSVLAHSLQHSRILIQILLELGLKEISNTNEMGLLLPQDQVTKNPVI